jgi:hypothetical protein
MAIYALGIMWYVFRRCDGPPLLVPYPTVFSAVANSYKFAPEYFNGAFITLANERFGNQRYKKIGILTGMNAAMQRVSDLSSVPRSSPSLSVVLPLSSQIMPFNNRSEQSLSLP